MIHFIICRRLSVLAGCLLLLLLYSSYTYHTQNRKRADKNGHALNERFMKGLDDLHGVCVLHGLFLHAIMEKEVQSYQFFIFAFNILYLTHTDFIILTSAHNTLFQDFYTIFKSFDKVSYHGTYFCIHIKNLNKLCLTLICSLFALCFY